MNCKHEPNWSDVHIEYEDRYGEECYIDVNCKLCGKSGCIGTIKALEAGIVWEESP